MSEKPLLYEEGSYEWPCTVCGRMFVPKRVHWPTGDRHSKVCGSCAWKALEKFLAEPEEP